jgi:MFS family permease
MSPLPKLDLTTARAIPTGVWVLGFVSLLMDLSSEMIHALLPLYLVTAFGASMLAVGVIEGIAEATASIVKIFSGALSDRLGHRKWLAAFGYGLAALTKPIFPLAATLGLIVAARFIDRVGKGIRGAPRDALVADLSPPHLRGASFGLRQSLDTVGAILGPLAAMLFMALLADDFIAVFWIAVIPALLSFALIAGAVGEPQRAPTLRAVSAPLSPAELRRLGEAYWWVAAFSTVFTFARFSEAFLVLRAHSIGLPLALTPAVLVLMNVLYAASAYPAGVLSDRHGRLRLLSLGFALLIAADLALALMPSLTGLALGVALWGLHMGLTQGVLATLVADTAPAELRGTAFGMFNLVTGLATLGASIIAGALWDAIGPAGTFLAGAAFTAVALGGFASLGRRLPLGGRL